MANLIYTNATKLIGDGTIDWDDGGSTFRVLLTTSTYTPDVDAHLDVADVTNELSGGSYVRKDIATRAVTKDDANNRSDYEGDAISWTGLTNGQTAVWAILFKFVTVDADSPLIAALEINSGSGVVMTGDVEIKWNNEANGPLFRISAV